MTFLYSFIIGGALCAAGQVLIDRTRLTPARILTGYVLIGVFLSAVGLYGPFAEFAGAGATVPLTGFGHLLASGAREAVSQRGIIGALTGPATAAAGGVTAALIFALLAAVASKPTGRR
ncbi:MAG: SpoVA/SpoVAEb family sporulation membrane protein [Oscillospiraceae bacterium]|jgi:stage V sporulation protein AE|nr:SpoVA/SpoVAEb family sporulation membrane protein [Oscillospiraceae bacterium]